MKLSVQVEFENLAEAARVINLITSEEHEAVSFNLTEEMLSVLQRKNANNPSSAISADEISTAILQDPRLSDVAKDYYVYERGLPSTRVKTAMNQGLAASGKSLKGRGAVETVGEPGSYKYYLA